MSDSTAGKFQAAGTGLRAVVGAAALVVVIAGVQAAGEILLPILFAVFLSILAAPAVELLKRIKVPGGFAVLIVVLAVALVLVGATGLLVNTVRGFTAEIPQYEEPFLDLFATTVAQAESYGFSIKVDGLTEYLQPAMVMTAVGQTLNALVAVLQRLVVVTLTMTFILFETNELAHKTRLAFGEDGSTTLSFGQAPTQVQRYLFINSCTSALTGAAVGIWCSVLGLEFAMLWGMTAFLLNYIPSIGSIIAAVPPVLLAIVTLGWPSALAVAAGYAAVNVILGNFLEPRLLGRTLGLSPLVVFLSLLFWGWLWGPAGMLFCVPLTVIFKLILEGNDDTRWVAILLGSGRELREMEERLAAKVSAAEA